MSPYVYIATMIYIVLEKTNMQVMGYKSLFIPCKVLKNAYY